MVTHVVDDLRRIGRQRDRASRDEAVDVVHPEADPLEMERGDGAIERFGLFHHPGDMLVRGQRANRGEEIVEAAARRLPVVGRHRRHCKGVGPGTLIKWNAMDKGRGRIKAPDLSERGGPKAGVPQRLDERLFMQFLAFGGCTNTEAVARHLQGAQVEGVLYEDVNDPRGIAILTLAKSPERFVEHVRPALNAGPFADLAPKPDYTMLGRTYSLGYEPDLADTLIERPRRTVLNPAWGWAVWYPLRRSGRFARLPEQKQRTILAEHGAIGISFGAADYAHDVRLACHGLDRDDNDFVIGLIGKDLFPLSAVVQTMRRTQQTALYLDRLGPFFVGRVAWRASLNP
jgi:chlorite dismutase